MTTNKGCPYPCDCPFPFSGNIVIAVCLNHDSHKIFRITWIKKNPENLFNLVKILVQIIPPRIAQHSEYFHNPSLTNS